MKITAVYGRQIRYTAIRELISVPARQRLQASWYCWDMGEGVILTMTTRHRIAVNPGDTGHQNFQHITKVTDCALEIGSFAITANTRNGAEFFIWLSSST